MNNNNMEVMKFLEPISPYNIYQLEPGEWIWDNKLVTRRIHERCLDDKTTVEPIGFRQIDILDLKSFGVFNSRPFMLSSIDNIEGSRWECFEPGRFYRFKKEEVNNDI